VIRLLILAVLAGLLAGALTAIAIYGPELPAGWLGEVDPDALAAAADRRLFLGIAVLAVLAVVVVDVIRRRRRRRRPQ
jgi:hypothetical protein